MHVAVRPLSHVAVPFVALGVRGRLPSLLLSSSIVDVILDSGLCILLPAWRLFPTAVLRAAVGT